jgi:putative heme iron utilization protein
MTGSDAALARRLLRVSRQGALSTLMADGGAPYGSLVAVASHPDGSPLLLISRLAVHTQNLLADPRVSLLLSTAGAADPLQEARIMLAAEAEPLAGDAAAMGRRRYLAAQPAAELFVDFPDFLLVRLKLEAIHLVAGFGRISDLAPADVLTDLDGAAALLEAEEGAIVHMNEDHADALNLYATVFCGAPAGSWLCTGIDPDGMDLAAEGTTLRVDFPARVTTPGALRSMLAQLASQARDSAASR